MDETSRILTTVNHTTGEMKQTLLGKPTRKKQRSTEPGMPFGMLTFEGAQTLEESAEIHGFDFRLFFHLWRHMRYQNYLTINQSALAKKMDVNRVQVNRTIRKFVDSGVMFPCQEDGVTYRMSPKIGYRGTQKEQKEAIAELERGEFKVIAGGPLE